MWEAKAAIVVVGEGRIGRRILRSRHSGLRPRVGMGRCGRRFAGGLWGDGSAPTFQELAELFRNEVPDLWKGKHRIITEFGRSIFAPIGWAATKVEYTKQSGDRQCGDPFGCRFVAETRLSS